MNTRSLKFRKMLDFFRFIWVLAKFRCCDMFSAMFCIKKTTAQEITTQMYIFGKVLKQGIYLCT